MALLRRRFRRLLAGVVVWIVVGVLGAGIAVGQGDGPTPEESKAGMKLADHLAVDLLLSEPQIAQPVFVNFDERGRMWVVEYRQYPRPAGLKEVSRDNFWRVVYDKQLPPPPYAEGSPFRGKDRISIHEDADGDGVYETHKVFVDGLNITTAVERGRGGVWVLTPPQLVFYPDADGDDVPDGEPVVHLTGFGLEDTHSSTNSLRWGPDGWLYASQGSTVSGEVRRPGIEGPGDEPVARTMGQLIWRYHPETRRYEVFAEGGGNAYGVELDDAGRVFSGHNGGNTRGFHYVQGGYLQKNFSKHGELSNPYAFGYFPPMGNNPVERFTHNFVIYGGGALPDRYRGKLLGIEPLQGRVVMSEIRRVGATFETEDLGHPLVNENEWFRPVDVKVGPDGDVYLADFHEKEIGHLRHFEGAISPETGRVWRLRGKDASAGVEPFDLSKMTTDELIDLLGHENRWWRQTALRVLGDRRDRGGVERMRRMVAEEGGQLALEALWALNLSGGFDEATVEELGLLRHPEPTVRMWAVRLMGDMGRVSSPMADRLVRMANEERDVEVRGQLASTARRLEADAAMQIVAGLLGHDEDLGDPYLPLLIWWAIESKCGVEEGRAAVLAMIREKALWKHAVVREAVLPRLMRRFAATGSQRDLLVCAELLETAPDQTGRAALLRGFEQAFEGRRLPVLPQRLAMALESAGGGSLILRIRQGDVRAVSEALQRVMDHSVGAAQRAEITAALGQVRAPGAREALLQLALDTAEADEVRGSALSGLLVYEDEAIGKAVTAGLGAMTGEVRTAALGLLAARPDWAMALVDAVQNGRVARQSIPAEAVEALRLFEVEALAKAVRRVWPEVKAVATTESVHVEAARIKGVVNSGRADPYAGKLLYMARCGACHRLFDSGGSIGPELTVYQRDDLDALLTNIMNPSGEIREGFESFVVRTKDGRVLSGFLADQTEDRVIVRGLDGSDMVLERAEVTGMQPLGRSLMPDGLLTGLSDQQLRDLMAYLRAAQPLNE